ncbi:hypothetical protein [Companilactobacillus allii]|nr:hypothetical protein [Companilactobacillus allii]
MTQILIGVTSLLVIVGILVIPTDANQSSKDKERNKRKEGK